MGVGCWFCGFVKTAIVAVVGGRTRGAAIPATGASLFGWAFAAIALPATGASYFRAASFRFASTQALFRVLIVDILLEGLVVREVDWWVGELDEEVFRSIAPGGSFDEGEWGGISGSWHLFPPGGNCV